MAARDFHGAASSIHVLADLSRVIRTRPSQPRFGDVEAIRDQSELLTTEPTVWSPSDSDALRGPRLPSHQANPRARCRKKERFGRPVGIHRFAGEADQKATALESRLLRHQQMCQSNADSMRI